MELFTLSQNSINVTPFKEISYFPRKYHTSIGKSSKRCVFKGKGILALGNTLRVNHKYQIVSNHLNFTDFTYPNALAQKMTLSRVYG